MKTSSYLAQVLDVYVTALADLQARTFRPKRYWQELRLATTRPLGTGFFLPGRRKRLYTPEQRLSSAPVVAKILGQDPDGAWRVSCRHQWPAEQKVSILVPGLKRPVLPPGQYGLESDSGERVGVLHSGQTGRLCSDHPHLHPGFMLRLCPEE